MPRSLLLPNQQRVPRMGGATPVAREKIGVFGAEGASL